MKLKFAALFSVAALIGAAAATPASAGTLSWNFYTLTGMPANPGSTTWPGHSVAGTTATFTQGGFSLVAQSATSSGCTSPYSTWCPGSADLYAKNGGTAEEQGLGLTGDPFGSPSYNEIYSPNGIYLNLTGAGHATDVMIGSVQGTSASGESWAVWGSNNGFSWTPLGSGMGGGIVNFDSASLLGYDQLIVSDPSPTPYINSNDVVLMGITTVPEPGTLALFAAGLLGCVLVLRRRARQG